MKWDSVISRLPNLTTSTSSYDFTITQVFGIFKLYITVSAVYCVDPSSCIYVKIPNLTSVLRLVSVFPYFFLWFVAMFCADDKCLSKGNNSKNKIGKSRKKVGESLDTFFNSGHQRKICFISFKNVPYRKKNFTVAILGTKLWPTTVV